MTMRLFLVALALLHSGVASGSPVDGPTQTVERFVAFYFNSYEHGIPGAKERAELSPLVTKRFMNLLVDASQAMECDLKASGGQVPPPSEGDLFVSLFEGATSADEIAVVEATKDRATYSVSWSFKDPLPGREREAPAKWKDNILLENISGRWLIDDFSHEGTWGFMTKGSVSKHLEWVAKQCGKF
jgi:hypothetical protein